MRISDRTTGKLICDSPIGPLSSYGHETYSLHGKTNVVHLTAAEVDYLHSLRVQAFTPTSKETRAAQKAAGDNQ